MFARVRAAITPSWLVASFALKNKKKKYACCVKGSQLFFNLLLPARGAGEDFCRPKLVETTGFLFFARCSLLMSQRRRSPAVATDDVLFQGFVLRFAGFPSTRRAELYSFGGCKSHFNGAELKRVDRERFCSHSQETMRR